MPIISKNSKNLEYLTATNIPVPHGFTTRFGGVSEGIFHSLNLGLHRGDKDENVLKNYGILADTIGFSTEKLVLSHQIHTDTIRVVTEKDCLGSLSHRDYPECDGLVTDCPGVALMVFTADCTPILLYDPVTGAVGAVHAGWRGTAMGIAGRAAETMVSAFGCDVKNIRAAIGPNIGPCCFSMDRDVPDAMLSALGAEAEPFIRPRDDKFLVDLKGLNALWLRRSGIVNIEISDNCTACESHRFWSHRVTKGQRGSQGTVILCKGGRI